MDPKIWGRSLWASLIYIAQVYPENPTPKDKQNYGLFFITVGKVLPCYACQKNYATHLQSLPIQLRSKTALLDWLHKLHNKTLEQMGRPNLSYADFLNKYIGQNTKSIFSNKCLLILLILAGIALGYYYFFYKKRSRPFVLVK